jgi:acetyl esterase/lipase
LRLDLHVPSDTRQREKPVPLVLFNPMGGMRICTKENAPWWLTEYGFAMASIEARVRDEAIAPAPVYDCRAAIRWLRTHASEYGYDANAIGVWGQSAGGLLTSLMATSGDRPELDEEEDDRAVSCRVQAACDECGSPHDLMYFARPEIKESFPTVAEVLQIWLGGPVEEQQELARFVSPATYVSSECPPILLLHGDADPVSPCEETIQFYHQLKEAEVDATLHVLSGEGHSWDPALTRDEIVAFFRRTLGSVLD